MDLCNWVGCDRYRTYCEKCNLISNRMHYSRNGHFEIKYNLKNLLVDAAIIAVVIGAVGIIVGSFPATFSKLLPFLE